MKNVKHIGDGYNGFDPVENRFIFTSNGDVVSVSDVKADQLFADFPKEWELVEEKKEPISYPKTGKK